MFGITGKAGHVPRLVLPTFEKNLFIEDSGKEQPEVHLYEDGKLVLGFCDKEVSVDFGEHYLSEFN